MLSASYEVVTGREPYMLRTYLLAVLVQMLAVNVLAEFGYLHVTIPENFGFATIAAGFVFGIGMVLSVGCAGAVFFRAGEGKLDYLWVVCAFAVGVWLSNDWIVEPVHKLFHIKWLSTSVYRALDIDRLLFIPVFMLAVIIWVLRVGNHPYKGGWKWQYTGLFIGLIGTAAWTVRATDGKPYGLGMMQGSDGLMSLLLEGDLSGLDGSLFMVLGVPLGSFIASRLYGMSPGRPLTSNRIWRALAGGLLMGISAAIAVGDNVLHGLSGVPIFALSSFSFMICAFFGVWAGVKLNWFK
jgi:uncharacterized membrane protein YedE/YeeE